MDVIRFAAAAMVAVYHLAFWVWTVPPYDAEVFRIAFEAWVPLVSSGWVGVHIFFVISGFVIAFSADQKSVGQFVRGRMARLYPACWICASVTFLLLSGDYAIERYVRTLLLLPVGPWVSGVYWTLAVEIAFYGLVAVTLAVAGSKALPRLGLFLVAYSGAFWLTKTLNHFAAGPLDDAFRAVENDVGYLLLAHDGGQFALGMLLWRCSRDGWTKTRATAVAGAFLVSLYSITIRSQNLSEAVPAAHFLTPVAIWLGATILIVGSVVADRRVWGWMGRWKSQIRILGLVTYPLYLVHSELGREIMLALPSIGAVPALLVSLTLVGLVALAVLPIETAIRRVLFPRAQPVVAQAAP